MNWILQYVEVKYMRRKQRKTEEKWPRRTEKYEGVVARKSSEENVSKRE